jgi:8-oxo-dGTP pyrophosphatase MutT (NUDIX family)
MPHIHEKIDFTAEAFIVHKNKVLLRMHDKLKVWMSVGGHIELDEDPVEAVIREVKEEVGLDVKVAGEINPVENEIYKYREIIAPKHLGRHNINDTHEHVVFVYYATSDTDEIKDSHSEHERTQTKWVELEELNTMDLLPNVKFYAMEALKELSKK